jgi:PAS domain S-box-containing protein
VDEVNQELAALAFRQAHCGISLVDRQGRYLAVNDRYCEILGRSREELLGMTLADVNHPDYHQSDLDAIRDLASGKLPLFVTEKKYVSPAGKEIWARLTAKSVKSLNGETCFLGTAEDISDQKKSETDLQKAYSQLQEAEKLAQMGRWSWDIASGEVEWSDELYQIYGFDRSIKPSFETYLKIVHPDDKGKLKEAIDRSLREKIPYQSEHRILRKDGSYRHMKKTGNLILDENGMPVRIEGIGYDVTVQRATELKAREGEIRFRQVLDAIPDLVLVKGPGSRIYWANKAFRDYYGMTNEELHGIIEAEFALPDQTPKYIKDDSYVFNTGRVLEIPQELVRGGSGEVRIFHTVKSPLRDESDRIMLTVGVSRDITEKLANEKAIEDQRIRLISSAKMSALGVMAGGIAHEINNPLGIIQGVTANLIDETGAAEASPSMREGLKKIYDTSVRIAKVVKGLRFFSRSAEFDPMTLADPSQIVHDMLELCSEKFRVNGVELKVGRLCQSQIECRPTEIAQVLLNLLQNAYDAVVETQKGWVELEAMELSGRVVFKVTDSGTGIDTAVVSRMMDPFFTTKEVGKGTGLGLSLSKGIVESHGGSLQYLEGMPNTTFVVSLPVKSRS